MPIRTAAPPSGSSSGSAAASRTAAARAPATSEPGSWALAEWSVEASSMCLRAVWVSYRIVAARVRRRTYRILTATAKTALDRDDWATAMRRSGDAFLRLGPRRCRGNHRRGIGLLHRAATPCFGREGNGPPMLHRAAARVRPTPPAIVLTFALLATLGIPSVTAAFSPDRASGPNGNTWVVKYRSGTSSYAAVAAVGNSGARQVGEIPEIDAHVVSLPSGKEARTLNSLRHDPRVLSGRAGRFDAGDLSADRPALDPGVGPAQCSSSARLEPHAGCQQDSHRRGRYRCRSAPARPQRQGAARLGLPEQ